MIAAYPRRVRNASAEPSPIVICAGFAQGINLLLRAVGRAGIRHVGTEDPSDRDTYAVAPGAGLEPVPVPVDELGIDVRALFATGARAVIVTSVHQAHGRGARVRATAGPCRPGERARGVDHRGRVRR